MSGNFDGFASGKKGDNQALTANDEILVKVAENPDLEPKSRGWRRKKNPEFEDRSLESEFFERKTPWAKIIISVVVILALLAGLGFTVFMLYKTDGDLGSETKPSVNLSGNYGEVPRDGVDPDAFYKQEGNLFPVSYEDWELHPASQLDDQNKPLEKMARIDFFGTTTELPSEADGFTSDPSQITDKDGGLNPLYSVWTDEGLKREIANILERFTNPSFGGWGEFQAPSENQMPVYFFDDIFTKDWLKANADKNAKDVLPVLADWEGDNYGGLPLTDGLRWIGEVESGSLTTVYNPETLSYSAKVVANVKYSAWATDQSILEKTGTITLDLVPNPDPSVNHTVLVNNASLEIK